MIASIVILIILVFFLLLVSWIGFFDLDKENNILGYILFVILFILIIITNTFLFYDSGYKKGQIDAINGKIEYELIEKENKTKTWEKIKE